LSEITVSLGLHGRRLHGYPRLSTERNGEFLIAIPEIARAHVVSTTYL
jgi:hypothetical protein